MQFIDFSGDSQLRQEFDAALRDERNLVLRSPAETDALQEFARSVVEGMSGEPRRLDCRFLYDAAGSALYERITEQPEYYPTRIEAALLERHAAEIRELTGPATLIELGSGSSLKTDHLLRAYTREDETVCYVPIDVSGSALLQAGEAIRTRRPEVQVVGVNGTYNEALALLPCASPVMVLFLGSTIGNLDEDASDVFWAQVTDNLAPGDYFLLGVDRVKDPAVLEAAYNDAAGVTAAFTNNLFARMNRELDSGLDLASITHVARYSAAREQMEIDARFEREQILEVAPLGRAFHVTAGESLRVEISRKFRIDTLQPYLARFGLTPSRSFTDERGYFSLLLLQREDDGRPTARA